MNGNKIGKWFRKTATNHSIWKIRCIEHKIYLENLTSIVVLSIICQERNMSCKKHMTRCSGICSCFIVQKMYSKRSKKEFTLRKSCKFNICKLKVFLITPCRKRQQSKAASVICQLLLTYKTNQLKYKLTLYKCLTFLKIPSSLDVPRFHLINFPQNLLQVPLQEICSDSS